MLRAIQDVGEFAQRRQSLAAESGDFYYVSEDGRLAAKFSQLGFNQFIKQEYFRRVQGDSGRQLRFGARQHGQSENPPPDNAENGDQVGQSFGAAKFGFLSLASRFENLVEHFDFPPPGLPVQLFDGLIVRSIG